MVVLLMFFAVILSRGCLLIGTIFMLFTFRNIASKYQWNITSCKHNQGGLTSLQILTRTRFLKLPELTEQIHKFFALFQQQNLFAFHTFRNTKRRISLHFNMNILVCRIALEMALFYISLLDSEYKRLRLEYELQMPILLPPRLCWNRHRFQVL